MIRLGILEAGRNLPELVAEYGEFGDWFIPFLDKANREVEYRIYKVNEGELPDTAQEQDAWLITGSEVSVYDDISWQNALGGFVLEAMHTAPVIGICYGHQLMHHINGGIVEKSKNGWAIGVHCYDVHEAVSWMRPPAGHLSLLVSHQDQVIKPAPNSKNLAGSEFCPIGISMFGTHGISMQPHPELDPILAAKVFAMREKEQGDQTTRDALNSLTSRIDDKIAANWIMNFVEERIR